MIIIKIEIAIQIFLQSIKVNKKIINIGKINSANDKPSQEEELADRVMKEVQFFMLV